jgi:HPr kinase/phosphorylase
MTRRDSGVTALLHATCLDFCGRGVLIEGPSGAGKSDLALRLIDQPGRGLGGDAKPAVLIADDQVVVSLKAGQLLARPPDKLKGLIEVRGLGILNIPYRPETLLRLVVTLMPAPEIERMPDHNDLTGEILGVRLPRMRLDPRLASAPARVRAALDALSAAEPAVVSTPSH